MAGSCPLCGGMLAPFWPHVWQAPDKRVLRCGLCASFVLDPPRTAAEQVAFDAAYDSYIDERAKLVGQHTDTRFEELVDDSIEVRFSDLAEHFPFGASVLEVGAERGGFLDRLKGRCTAATGVDACPEYAAILQAKGYAGYRYIDDLPPQARFDRICLFSLLEHVAEPVPFLQRLAGHLAADGLMIIEVPSAREPLVTLYDLPAFKSFYFQAMHPYVYSPEALEQLLARSGLECATMHPKQRYGLANHLQWLRHCVPGGSPVFATLFAGAAEQAYIEALERQGTTDTLYILARHREGAP